MANSTDNTTYQNPTALAFWANITTILSAIFWFIEYVILFIKGLSFTALSWGIFSPEIRGDILLFVTAVIAWILGTASIIFYFCWLYRVNSNAKSFGTQQMFFTPGWSVGCHFIPILNLVRPYQIMKEIIDVTFIQNSGNILFITWCWWLTYVLPYILGFCWSQYLATANVPHVPTIPVWFFLLSVLLSIPHLCFLVVMVNKITQRQVELSGNPIIIPAENQTPVEKPMGCCSLGFLIVLCSIALTLIIRTGVREGIIPKPSITPTLHWENFNDTEKAFLKRCPEVPLEKIPNDYRTIFMENYEEHRPQLDGQDVVLLSDENEITALRKSGYRVEKEGQITFEPDIVLLIIRIKDSKNIYLQICQSYCSSFISSFLKSVEEKQ